jgi:hypothetical protein
MGWTIHSRVMKAAAAVLSRFTTLKPTSFALRDDLLQCTSSVLN